MAVIDQVIAALVLAAVVMLPGTAWLVLLRTDRTLIPLELVPGALVTITSCLVGLVELVALTAHWGLKLQLALLVLLALAHVPVLLVRRRAQLRAFAWWRADHATWVTLGIALAAGISAFLVGGALRSDALYHVAVAEKLVALGHPSFSNIQAFVDGGPHPGYLLPVTHAMVALVAGMLGMHPATVQLASPGAMIPIAVLSTAGASGVLFRSRLAVPLGAVAACLLVLDTQEVLFSVFQSIYPREVCTAIAMPVVLAAWIAAMRSDTRGPLWRSVALLAFGIVAVSILHVSYVYLVGIWFAGYLLFWLLMGSVRAEWRRHMLVSVVALVVTVASVAPTLPQLRTLDAFAQSSTVEKAMVEDLPGQPSGLKFGQLFIGNKDGYHLRPDSLVWHGGLALLGAVCAAAAALLGRRRSAMFLGGTMFVVLALTLSDQLFPLLVKAEGTSQARRIYLAVPSAWGIAALLLFAGWALARAESWRRTRLARTGVLATLVAIGVAASSVQLEREVVSAHIPLWPLYAAFALVAVVALAALLWRTRVLRVPQRLAGWDPTGQSPVRLAHWTLLATLVLVLACAPAVWRGSKGIANQAGRRHWGPGLTHNGLVPTRRIRNAISRHGVKAPVVVMAPPDLAYELTAAAPVYVVASIPGHQANTKKNRVYDRYQEVLDFYGDDATSADRLHLIDTSRANVLVMLDPKVYDKLLAKANRRGLDLPEGYRITPGLQHLLDTEPKLFHPIGHAREFLIFKINRSQLPAAERRAAQEAAP